MKLKIQTVSPSYFIINYNGNVYYYLGGEITAKPKSGIVYTVPYDPVKYPHILSTFISYIKNDPLAGQFRELDGDVKIIISYHEDSDTVTTFSIAHGYKIYSIEEIDRRSYSGEDNEEFGKLVKFIYENPDKVLYI